MRPSRFKLASVAAAGALAVGVVIQWPMSSSAQTQAQAQAEAQTASTQAAAGQICNRYCDGRDAASAAGDRIPVNAAVHGRSVKLHVNDADSMAWASLETGNPADEVWLDRSFDGGKTWSAGSRLGATKATERSARTTQFNVDDWNTRGVGLVRACGKAGDRTEIACTPWARSTWNASTRSTAAATALMTGYDQNTGLFANNAWWTSANALTAVMDNISSSSMGSYRYAIANTYDKQKNAHAGQFRNEFLDDTAWWGLAWIKAYDLTKDQRYLDTARADADHLQQYWDTTCGGGVWWKTDKKAKNAIENSLYIQLNAQLSQRIAGDTTYRGRAQAGWKWFNESGLVNGQNLVNDGLNMSTCKNNGSTTWTYNQGVLVNALTELHRTTGDATTLAKARSIADAMTSKTGLSPAGVLQEPPNGNNCDQDGGTFKGAAIRGLGVLNKSTNSAYSSYLKTNADSAWSTDRNAADFYGWDWAPVTNGHSGTGHTCQLSALDLLNAAS